jgi:hypothetical protein
MKSSLANKVDSWIPGQATYHVQFKSDGSAPQECVHQLEHPPQRIHAEHGLSRAMFHQQDTIGVGPTTRDAHGRTVFEFNDYPLFAGHEDVELLAAQWMVPPGDGYLLRRMAKDVLST